MAMTLKFLLLLLLLLFLSTSTATTHHKSKLRTLFKGEDLLFQSQNQNQTPPPTPTTLFQVTTPITPPPNSIRCSTLVLTHDFGFTYGQSPANATYTPPTACIAHRNNLPSLAVLELSASCAGIQFDRIFGVWLSGVEILRSCTAEPSPSGIVWTVKKDITKYSSLLTQPQTLVVYLGNLVNSMYTGVYHVNISIHLYFDDRHLSKKKDTVPGFSTPADLVLPISRSLPLTDGLWFVIQSSTDTESKEILIPRNAFRAVLEVYVSFHSDDEFWYTNPPNDNGAFREVIVSLDGELVGVVWPFTVIYTGGINPLFWRPVTGIGSFDLPTYDIEITPFLGKLLDGREHSFGFGVTDALDYWNVDANLHLWLDNKSDYTEGSLIKYEAPKPEHSLVSLNGDFITRAHRQISSTGWVKSSYGNITTNFFQRLDYENLMESIRNGSTQIVNQTIEFNYGTYAKHPSMVSYSEQVYRKFPLYLYGGTSNEVNNSYDFVENVTLGYNEKKFAGEQSGLFFSTLKNLQNCGETLHVKGNLVTSRSVSTQEVYRYESTKGCYFRNVSSIDQTILHDEAGDSCKKDIGNFPPR